MVDKPSTELDFGYHSLDRTSIDGNTDSPRTLHTVEENLHESQENSSHDETQSIDRISGKSIARFYFLVILIKFGKKFTFFSFSAVLNDNTSVDGSHGSSEHLVKNQNSASVASELSSLVSFESGFDDGSSVASTVAEGRCLILKTLIVKSVLVSLFMYLFF